MMDEDATFLAALRAAHPFLGAHYDRARHLGISEAELDLVDRRALDALGLYTMKIKLHPGSADGVRTSTDSTAGQRRSEASIFGSCQKLRCDASPLVLVRSITTSLSRCDRRGCMLPRPPPRPPLRPLLRPWPHGPGHGCGQFCRKCVELGLAARHWTSVNCKYENARRTHKRMGR